MTTKKLSNKLNFYTEHSMTTKGWWVGLCRERPELSVEKSNRSTALSAIKRLHFKTPVGSTTPTNDTPPVVPIPQPVEQKHRVNRIAFVIDRSGSMRGLEANVIQALNSNIKTLQQQDIATDQKTFVTVITFNEQIEVIRAMTSVFALTPIHQTEIQARGQTALMDAVAKASSVMTNYPVFLHEDVGYLVITLTDGEENCSRMFTKQSFIKHLSAQQATDAWTFTFQVPPGHAQRVINEFNVPPGNVMEWKRSVRGVQQVTTANNSALGGYYAMRSTGLRRSNTFYTDTKNITARDVAKNLVDVRRNVNIANITRLSQIREACEQHFGRYEVGHAYYELQKTEKVQHHKLVLLVDRSSGAVYAGTQARELLGIPSGHGEVRVAPGDHSKFDVFVQSTSWTRKVYPGSRVIYFNG